MMRAIIPLVVLSMVLYACGPKTTSKAAANPDQLKAKYGTGIELAEAQALQEAEVLRGKADMESALAEDELNNAQVNLQKAEAEKDKDKKKWYELQAQRSAEKAYAQQVVAADKYAEANKKAYTTYKTAADRNLRIAPEHVKELGAKTSKEAADAFAKAEGLRAQAKGEKDLKKKTQLLQQANELEFLAVDEQRRVLDIYTGKQKIEAPIEVVQQKDPEDEQPEKTEIVETVRTASSIVYKVQIAASRTELPSDKLLAIYTPQPGEFINNNIEDGWYKYAVGRFSTYAEAQAYKDAIAVQGSFIIAYQENQKILLPEIREKIERGELPEPNKTGDNVLPNSQSDVIYMVQIAATQIPARPSQLQEMYHGKQIVSIRQARGWYKYTVGNFDSREKAEAFRQEISVPGAFVVAFDKNGNEQNIER